MTDIVKSDAVQNLLDRASGISESGGNPRLKAITRDVLEALMQIIEKHDISESEFWQATQFLQDGAQEFGLIAPGVGIEHFLDRHMDAKDAEAGQTGGTPRTIEGPLYVAGAPLVDGDLSKTNDVNLTDDPDDTPDRMASRSRMPSFTSGMRTRRVSTRISIPLARRAISTIAGGSSSGRTGATRSARRCRAAIPARRGERPRT